MSDNIEYAKIEKKEQTSVGFEISPFITASKLSTKELL